MKVVIFCGGYGVRMGEETQRVPKPMVQIGGRPILRHIMGYYAAWGHTEFILCLGYKGDVIEEYFRRHEDAVSDGPGGVELRSPDSPNWEITFADTGLEATIGERLKAVERHIGDDDLFLATYGDGLVDAPLDDVVDAAVAHGKIAQFLSVKPQFNAHLVHATPDGELIGLTDMSESDIRINGGFFTFRREILDFIEPGDELVEETFAQLIERREVVAYAYDGFFGPMDTVKDKQRLESLCASGRPPWRLVPSGRVPVLSS